MFQSGIGVPVPLFNEAQRLKFGKDARQQSQMIEKPNWSAGLPEAQKAEELVAHALGRGEMELIGCRLELPKRVAFDSVLELHSHPYCPKAPYRIVLNRMRRARAQHPIAQVLEAARRVDQAHRIRQPHRHRVDGEVSTEQ